MAQVLEDYQVVKHKATIANECYQPGEQDVKLECGGLPRGFAVIVEKPPR
jgi:hypothetical protein